MYSKGFRSRLPHMGRTLYLGRLAGLAIRAGARSTLATLWQVSDQSTIKFMERFYQELSIPGTSKAIALHRAQQALFNEPNYQAPYYWSPYVLVGNWR